MNATLKNTDFSTFNDPENAQHWQTLELCIPEVAWHLGYSAQWIERLFLDLLEITIDLKRLDDSVSPRFDVRRFHDVTVRYYLYRELCVVVNRAQVTKAGTSTTFQQKNWSNSDWVMVAIYGAFSPVVAALNHHLTAEGRQAVQEILGQLLTTPDNLGAIFNYRANFTHELARYINVAQYDIKDVERVWVLYAHKVDAGRDAQIVADFLPVTPNLYGNKGTGVLQPSSPMPELPVITLAQFTAMLPTTVSALDIARVTADRTTFNVLEVSLLAKRIIEGE